MSDERLEALAADLRAASLEHDEASRLMVAASKRVREAREAIHHHMKTAYNVDTTRF